MGVGSLAGVASSKEYRDHNFIDLHQACMTTRHFVDPDIAPMPDVFPALRLTRETLGQIRAILQTKSRQGTMGTCRLFVAAQLMSNRLQ